MTTSTGNSVAHMARRSFRKRFDKESGKHIASRENRRKFTISKSTRLKKTIWPVPVPNSWRTLEQIMITAQRPLPTSSK